MLGRLDYMMCQTNHDRLLAEIETAIPEDLEQIWKWNNTVPASTKRCVQEMIGDKAQAQPNAPAVCAWDGEVTYSKLDHLAMRLAGRLIDLGVGLDSLVPLCFEKSIWTTVARLGVLKAGRAFVMLDPSLPEQRLQAIIQQVKASLVVSSLSNQSLSSRLAQDVLTIGSEFFADQGDRANQRLNRSSPTSVAYVTFTSGSTETPKGVIITRTNSNVVTSFLPESSIEYLSQLFLSPNSLIGI
ncbi:hypothetical protein ABVK25_009271 [Lepraria finkii]|uniref:AMP-dependent synthetase/ligase domain-containing protein n=1 Tax=Lepraria finkii TaxID=1340010 RepID=A0ABR4AXQ3_9LECA